MAVHKQVHYDLLCVRSQHCLTLLQAMPALDGPTRTSNFDRIGLMEFVVDGVALGDFSPSSSVFACLYHSIFIIIYSLVF